MAFHVAEQSNVAKDVGCAIDSIDPASAGLFDGESARSMGATSFVTGESAGGSKAIFPAIKSGERAAKRGAESRADRHIRRRIRESRERLARDEGARFADDGPKRAGQNVL